MPKIATVTVIMGFVLLGLIGACGSRSSSNQPGTGITSIPLTNATAIALGKARIDPTQENFDLHVTRDTKAKAWIFVFDFLPSGPGNSVTITVSNDGKASVFPGF